jgi:cell division protein FtsI (penicillin-binding protein 3)
MRGVHLTGELIRFHPNRGLAQALLGQPAAEGRLAGGIERAADTLLAGIDGNGVVLRDRQGRRLESPSRLGEFPIPGHDVYLTIDAALQEIVEKALDDALYEFEATTGDVVVLNPNTGEILAVASRMANGRSTTSAFTSVFEPGSTAKVFAAAALLSEGSVQPTDSVWTENGTYVTEHRRIEDDHPNGWLTLQGVIEQSSNIGIVKFASRISPESQYRMLRSFGLGTPTAVEYPSESAGRLSRPDAWSGITGQSMAMGYEISVTPLQLAQAYAAIANGGVLLKPTLLSKVSAPDGAIVYRHVPEPVRRVLSAAVAEQLRTALRGVVYRGGTGETAALRGYEVAGKTGTARRSGPQGYVSGSYTASFISLFPADRPQLVTVVKLDDPKGTYARLTAVPLTRAVLEQVLAGETQALDRGELGGVATRAELNQAGGQAEVRHVFPWPDSSSADRAPDRPIPNVVGIPVRDAVRRMHEAGLRVQLSRVGDITDTDPRPGTVVAAGTLVRLVVR